MGFNRERKGLYGFLVVLEVDVRHGLTLLAYPDSGKWRLDCIKPKHV